MRPKSKTNYVANGIMTFIEALIHEHHADELAVYRRVVRLSQAQVDRLEGLDAQRNK
jgi:hypothetical protein